MNHGTESQKRLSATDFSNTRILVTGAAGFIGKNLLEKLLAFDCEIYALDKAARPADFAEKITYLQTDLLSENIFHQSKTNKFDYVFHLAARTDLDGKTLDEYRENTRGTENLIRQIDTISLKRFVFYSTQLVVGLHNQTRFLDSYEPYSPNTIYGQSKVVAEKIVKSLAEQLHFSFA